MTNDQDLKAAEEYATQCVTWAWWEKADGEISDFRHVARQAYLAGLAAGRNESKWVKCSDVMPQIRRLVLVSASGDVMEGRWYGDDWVCGDDIMSRNAISHWQPPPPAPPKEGE